MDGFALDGTVEHAVARTHAKVCIIGTGYVGTANAVGFAELGCQVTGYDIDAGRIASLRAGRPPYREDGLEARLRWHLEIGRLRFVDDLRAAVKDAAFVIVTVATPSKNDGAADLSALEAVVQALGAILPERAIVVLRSTVPPGTSDVIASQLSDEIKLLYCPEFLREGSAVRDFLHPDRTIIGANCRSAAASYAALLKNLAAPVMVTNRLDAELIKGWSNAFLAMKISFANEVANLCASLDADVRDVLRGLGCDRRIGDAYLEPGIGFGGPCFEKDVKSLDLVARRMGAESELLSATLRVNEAQPHRIVDALEEELGTLQGVHVGVWGLAFKAGTDDVRSSLALRILAELHERGATARAYDPAVSGVELPSGTTFAASAMEATHADALLVLTEWPEFRSIDPMLIATALRRRVVVDGRNLLDGERLARFGLRYRGVGRAVMPAGMQSASVPA